MEVSVVSITVVLTGVSREAANFSHMSLLHSKPFSWGCAGFTLFWNLNTQRDNDVAF